MKFVEKKHAVVWTATTNNEKKKHQKTISSNSEQKHPRKKDTGILPSLLRYENCCVSEDGYLREPTPYRPPHAHHGKTSGSLLAKVRN